MISEWPRQRRVESITKEQILELTGGCNQSTGSNNNNATEEAAMNTADSDRLRERSALYMEEDADSREKSPHTAA